MPHLEIFAGDIDAAKSFYSGLFGWRYTPLEGAEDSGYFLALSDALAPGLSVALIRRPDTAHPAGSAVRGAIITFNVDNCDDAYAWALAHGGAEALPPADYPGMGRRAYIEDGFGNIVGLKHQLGN